MRLIKFVNLALFLSLSLVFGAPKELSVFENQTQNKSSNSRENIYKNIAPSDENTDLDKDFSDPFISQSSLVLSADEYETRVFVGEVFSINLKAKTSEITEFDFELSFQKEGVEFLNPNVKWVKNNDFYEARLYFQALSSNATLDEITLKLTRNKEAFTQSSLILNPFIFKSVMASSNYANLVADELVVNKVKTSYFDDKNVIMMLELSAKNANLKSFKMPNLKKQGIENLRGDFNASNAFYYAVFPAFKNEFEFSYFNKLTNSFENFNLKLKISEEDLSTQSDLNPTNRDFNVYKQYAFWGIALLFALFFIFKKNLIILSLAIISFALGFLVNTSGENATLKSGSKLKILPTEPSTYFYTSLADEEVEILGSRQNYIKILLKDGKIGWVNEDELKK